SYDDDHYDVEEDLRTYMKGKLKKRKRLNPVRLEVDSNLDAEDKEFLCKNFEINEKMIFLSKTPFQLGFIFGFIGSLPEKIRKEFSYESFDPQPSAMVNLNRTIIDQVLEKDIILSYPYESMEPLIRLLDEAATDPNVASIKITLYRIAKDSKIAQSLIKASENGKEVIVLMELRARFDEDNNIFWSSRLEEAGCKIVYGFDHYKCHSKVCLITRYGEGDVSFITQIATGNYNEKTAKVYTDFSFMTSDMVIGQDAKDLFDNILIGNLEGSYEKLMVSPKSMPEGLEKLIKEEIKKAQNGEDAYIRLKMNSISDRGLIDLLSKASKAGVEIKMMVRGITCLLPGVNGVTDNIEIYQIVGRFLEHHRVYQFGREDPKVYISSADFMTRNIRKRVEVAVPLEDSEIKNYVLGFLDTMFADDVKIRKLSSTGEYLKVENKHNFNAQEELMKKAISDNEQRKIQIKENDLANNHKIIKYDAPKKPSEKMSFLDLIRNLFKN
uniref:polyphosphate kinase 1 n=1 Tax=uncultured Anaerococcus sp. TaxID=293428 RepID=UPI00288B2533